MALLPVCPAAPQPHLGDAAPRFAARFGAPEAHQVRGWVVLVFPRPTYRLAILCEELRVVAVVCTYPQAPLSTAACEEEAHRFLPRNPWRRWGARRTRLLVTDQGWTLAQPGVLDFALRAAATL